MLQTSDIFAKYAVHAEVEMAPIIENQCNLIPLNHARFIEAVTKVNCVPGAGNLKAIFQSRNQMQRSEQGPYPRTLLPGSHNEIVFRPHNGITDFDIGNDFADDVRDWEHMFKFGATLPQTQVPVM
ncbi:MAG: hypothetical protein Q9200_004768 [Gallowayella weberi]